MLGLVLAFLAMPIWLLAALVASVILPGTLRVLRIAWFLFLYLAVEVLALTLLFALWIGSGFGWKLQSAAFQHAHYRLLGLMLRLIVGSAKRAFNLRIELQNPPAQTVGADPGGWLTVCLGCEAWDDGRSDPRRRGYEREEAAAFVDAG